MTILPSPIPHPLEFSPFEVPGWAYEALEWVVGFDWPEGDEQATWDVADRWYRIANLLADPRDEAFDAAHRVISGYGGGTGVSAQAFIGAWDKVAVEDRAPLMSLLEIADELGKLVEECGRDIEGAKLEAWIEIGLFLTELVGAAIVVTLTLGAASPAAGGLIAATRFAIQQIFQRLVERLGRKALKKTLKEAGERAAKQLTTREGLQHLGREAVTEGLAEMGEEAATDAGIQLHQTSTGRADGPEWKRTAKSAAGGFVGGFAAAGAGLGRSGPPTGISRGMGAEVLGELGASAVSGDLPDLEDLGKAASSGAAGAALDSTRPDMTGLTVPQLDPLELAPAALDPAGSTGGRSLTPQTAPQPAGPASSVAALDHASQSAPPTSTPSAVRVSPEPPAGPPGDTSLAASAPSSGPSLPADTSLAASAPPSGPSLPADTALADPAGPPAPAGMPVTTATPTGTSDSYPATASLSAAPTTPAGNSVAAPTSTSSSVAAAAPAGSSVAAPTSTSSSVAAPAPAGSSVAAAAPAGSSVAAPLQRASLGRIPRQ
ncbi:hypothetical protein Asp14428_47600 [Actinoplanes sp. NBRC 14428]|nr:hypothetical protein Asp14428_47600 [Actinoplanes sp. NBRC 14428]